MPRAVGGPSGRRRALADLELLGQGRRRDVSRPESVALVSALGHYGTAPYVMNHGLVSLRAITYEELGCQR